MSDNTNGEVPADLSTDRGTDVQPAAVSSPYKVLGQFSADNGVGVLGQNDAQSGTPIGVQGAVPNNSAGYGLATPDDAKIDGVLEASTLAGSLTGGTQLTDLIGAGLTVNGGTLGLPTSGNDGEILKWDSAANSWVLASDESGSAGAGAGLSVDGSGNHQINAGKGLSINSDMLDVAAGDGLTITGGGNLALDQSGAAGQILKYDGTGWYLDVDSDTDTRTNVSDNGAPVVTDTDDIDFQSSFAVTDDGDNSVSVDLSNDSITITAGNGLTGGGSTSLGESTTIAVQPLGAEVYLDSDTEYNNTGTWTKVEFNTEVADNFDYFNTSKSLYQIPTSGDYDVDVDLNLWGLSGGSLLEARVFSPSLGKPLMYTNTATPESSQSISLSKILKDLGAGTTLEVQLKYDGTGALDGGSRHLSTWSINKVA